ncbi:MAG: PPOX class F420-dependent oxidoreductase [Chloroflexota bacterium]
MTFTDEQAAYLTSQRLGRLATVDRDGAPQNNPVGYRYNPDLGTLDIGGHNLAASRKFRNLAVNSRVAFVVDDIVSYRPWRVRCLEVRGHAEALSGQDPLRPGFTTELIRIHPDRILSFGLTGDGAGPDPLRSLPIGYPSRCTATARQLRRIVSCLAGCADTQDQRRRAPRQGDRAGTGKKRS